jgi:predicted AAA+ superfamily ATPase
MQFNSVDIDWGYLLDRLEHLLDLGEEFLTRKLAEYQFDPELFGGILVFRWQQEPEGRLLRPIAHPDLPRHDDLIGLDPVLQQLRRNTRQFVLGAPANHILLWGPGGSGKSSAIKGLLSEFGSAGLRLIEIRREDIPHLPEITAQLRPHPYRFILFCDDLPLDAREWDCRELKNLLDGGLEVRPDNVLVYATGHTARPNFEPRAVDESLQPEQLPMADGFGMILDFPPPSEETYLRIVRHLADQRKLPIAPDRLAAEARQWLQQRKSRSGRSARQFVDDLTGRLHLNHPTEN